MSKRNDQNYPQYVIHEMSNSQTAALWVRFVKKELDMMSL